MLKKLCKGLLWSVALTLALVLGFAFIIRQANLSDAVIKPVVQVIKVLCILIGVAIAIRSEVSIGGSSIRSTAGRGWLWGGIVGILYTVLVFCIFSAIDGSFAPDISALNDLVFAMVIGVISAMILRGQNRE
jgi:putative membrane protein (TIGR04086 family)